MQILHTGCSKAEPKNFACTQHQHAARHLIFIQTKQWLITSSFFFYSILRQSGAVSTMCRQLSRIAAFVQADARPMFCWPRSASTARCQVHSGCEVECRICNREVASSNLSPGYFAPRSTQPSIPPGSVNEYQLRLGRQR